MEQKNFTVRYKKSEIFFMIVFLTFFIVPVFFIRLNVGLLVILIPVILFTILTIFDLIMFRIDVSDDEMIYKSSFNKYHTIRVCDITQIELAKIVRRKIPYYELRVKSDIKNFPLKETMTNTNLLAQYLLDNYYNGKIRPDAIDEQALIELEKLQVRSR